VTWLLDGLVDLVCGFGESVTRVVLTLMLLFALSALGYGLTGSVLRECPGAGCQPVPTYLPVVTDKLASYPPVLKRVLPRTEHRRHKGLNNRAEHSHRLVRKRERALQRFKSPEHAQRFLEPFSAVGNHFRPRRHLLPATQYRQLRAARFRQWREAARLHPVA
jgi:hypothetical protein